jgi:phosphoribosyl-AMP cyclohydrolase
MREDMGMAIDQAKFDELRASFHDETSLLPVIVQDDESNEVLMLAYLSRASLDQSIDTGRATYFSRSRNEIWVKGETSGHRQWIRSISFDCDSDAILFRVHQEGVACHTGERSCFHHRVL